MSHLPEWVVVMNGDHVTGAETPLDLSEFRAVETMVPSAIGTKGSALGSFLALLSIGVDQ